MPFLVSWTESTGEIRKKIKDGRFFQLLTLGFKCPTDFEFDGIELLLLEMIPQHVAVAPLLLHGELPEGEAPHPAVTGRHPQGAAALRGHAGEALPPVEVVNCDALKVHVAAPESLGLLLQRSWNRQRGESGSHDLDKRPALDVHVILALLHLTQLQTQLHLTSINHR